MIEIGRLKTLTWFTVGKQEVLSRVSNTPRPRFIKEPNSSSVAVVVKVLAVVTLSTSKNMPGGLRLANKKCPVECPILREPDSSSVAVLATLSTSKNTPDMEPVYCM